MKTKLISIVVPCYNEATNIEEFIRRVGGLSKDIQPRKIECLFVDDGSDDDTGLILDRLADENQWIKVLHLAKNRGHQIAITAGIDYANGDVIVTMDADLQDPPELIKQMIAKIETGYDVVHAQRRRRTGENWLKIFTAKSFYWLLGKFSNTAVIENCGDFRAFTKPVQKIVAEFRMPHRFLRGTFVQVGFRQAIIQYDRDPRHSGKTKFSLMKMIHFSMDGFLGFSAAPIRILQWLSIFLWLISVIYLLKSLIAHFLLNATVPGWTSIIVLMFFFTGLILFSIAIIGSYVGRIFVQGQNLPLYWLRGARNIDFRQDCEGPPLVREVEMAQRTLSPQENEKKDNDN